MGMVKIDCHLIDHRKVLPLSVGAKLSYIFSILHSHRYLTDGLLDPNALDDVMSSAGAHTSWDQGDIIEELLRANLWERHDEGGIWVHDYLDYNPSRVAVLARREYEAERDFWDRIRPTVAPLVYERDRYICSYCGAGTDLTIDHIIPIANGGGHDIDNLTTACRACNSAKGAIEVAKWLEAR